MPSPRIDLNLFVVFEAIYNKRNLTHAADLLCVTQPAVSNALARMRKSQGLKEVYEDLDLVDSSMTSSMS